MPAREPIWWYGGRWEAVSRLLAPAGAIYGGIAKARYERARPYRSRLPVICIGNLVAGGAGKTPFALHVAKLLTQRGARPAFLSRGYGGSIVGPHVVDANRDRAAQTGDEPLLLARAAPTVVARDRAAGARLLETTSATHVIMDDGLQNPSLAKDLSFAVIDGERWIGNGRTIPGGPLRAPLDFQSRLVDALVVSRPTGRPMVAMHPLVAATFHCPIIGVTRRADGPVEWLREGPWIAFAGIGRPDSFFAMLEGLGARLAARVAFTDHHAWTAADAQRLIMLALTHRAGLVTTEKDLVRIDPAADPACAELKAQTRTIYLRLDLASEDAGLLDGMLRRWL